MSTSMLNPIKPKLFIKATKENAGNSAGNEPGVARFDVMQQTEDPTRFVLIEVYRTQEDATRHKETKHYNSLARNSRAHDG